MFEKFAFPLVNRVFSTLDFYSIDYRWTEENAYIEKMFSVGVNNYSLLTIDQKVEIIMNRMGY